MMLRSLTQPSQPGCVRPAFMLMISILTWYVNLQVIGFPNQSTALFI